MEGQNANAIDMLDAFIIDLEARLNLHPGQAIPSHLKVSDSSSKTKDAKKESATQASSEQNQPKSNKKKPKQNGKKKGPKKGATDAKAPVDQPDICKLEFKVGVITKVWAHPDADKLYCEEIDIAEDTGVRSIASGLRPHYTQEQMLGRRLLVITNLKAKNLKGFKSHGMVLCAASTNPDGSEKVEFVEPPEGAAIGEIITFEGLPNPQPLSPSQSKKRKFSCRV
mmetsp:Transcript_23037/g.52731  ORF Transcript_23037/g.52731 Transcript_23037/m.52731 type:complete len:225 (-) Transcript_23037:355-1029(-)